MKIRIGKVIDERFWKHRVRAGCNAGLVGGIEADLLFMHRRLVNHVFSWDLLAVFFMIAGVGLALMVWYRFTD
ncbi:MAG: hypothetical protein WCB11_02090 [Terriglobales bacterium]|jgi:hypothetical protein